MRDGGWNVFGLLRTDPHTHAIDYEGSYEFFSTSIALQPDVECVLVSKSAFLSLQLV